MRKVEYSLIGIVAVFTAVVLPVFNEGHTMDFGTTSDIVSALCNVAMAGAAIGAYLIAKDYFTDMVKKDGYEITKRINLELMPKLESTLHLTSINLLDIEVPNYINGELGVFDDETSTLADSLKIDLDTLKEKRKQNLKVTSEIQELKNSLEIYGWKMSKSKEYELEKLLKMNHELFIHIHNIIIYLSEILSRQPPLFLPKNKDKLLEGFNKDSPTSPPAAKNITLLCDGLIKAHQKLYRVNESTIYDQTTSQYIIYFSGGKHLKNYFEYKPN